MMRVPSPAKVGLLRAVKAQPGSVASLAARLERLGVRLGVREAVLRDVLPGVALVRPAERPVKEHQELLEPLGEAEEREAFGEVRLRRFERTRS